jgi:hypothetical protein
MVIKSTSHKSSKRLKPRSLFAAIRKPSAPPGHPMSNAKPDEKARPAQRKAKHKRKPEELPEPEDL